MRRDYFLVSEVKDFIDDIKDKRYFEREKVRA